MKHIINYAALLLLALTGWKAADAQHFFNTYPSVLSTVVNTVTDVQETGNAIYRLETETDVAASFHDYTRLIKTDTNGVVIWTKRFDAGPDTSLTAWAITRAADGNLLIFSELGHNNAPAPLGISIIKINAAGTVLWNTLLPGYRAVASQDIVQLSDASMVLPVFTASTFDPAVLHVDANGNALSARVFQGMMFSGQDITGFAAFHDTLSASFRDGEFVQFDTAYNVVRDKHYNLDMTALPYLAHTVLANGDLLFADGRVAGGLLSGKPRIFRTDRNLNLLWAKNIESYNSFTDHNPFRLFDVVSAVRIIEDPAGNIIVHLLDEGTAGMALALDANGGYLWNIVLPASSLRLCSTGDLLFATNMFAGNNSLLARQPHTAFVACDSSIDVMVTAGNDSAGTLATTASFTAAPLTAAPYALRSHDTAVTGAVLCPAQDAVGQPAYYGAGYSLYPSPATDVVCTAMPRNITAGLTIYNLTGETELSTTVTHAQQVDIGMLPPGMHIAAFTTGEQTVRVKFIKL